MFLLYSSFIPPLPLMPIEVDQNFVPVDVAAFLVFLICGWPVGWLPSSSIPSSSLRSIGAAAAASLPIKGRSPNGRLACSLKACPHLVDPDMVWVQKIHIALAKIEPISGLEPVE